MWVFSCSSVGFATGKVVIILAWSIAILLGGNSGLYAVIALFRSKGDPKLFFLGEGANFRRFPTFFQHALVRKSDKGSSGHM